MTADRHPILLRRATEEDADTVAALTDAAYAKYIPRLGRKPQPMTADYRLLAATHHIWLLCLGKRPVGVLVLMFEPEAVLIYSVAVTPAHQKQGLGRYLLSWAEQQARQAGSPRIRLYTNELMAENIALYRSLGYQETRREPYQGSTLVHMAKTLTV
jgi:ribosomal protein S18 acetylase RimI-like enzyme